jgi:hypothetical protein
VEGGSTNDLLPPFLFISRWIVQIKRNGGVPRCGWRNRYKEREPSVSLVRWMHYGVGDVLIVSNQGSRSRQLARRHCAPGVRAWAAFVAYLSPRPPLDRIFCILALKQK